MAALLKSCHFESCHFLSLDILRKEVEFKLIFSSKSRMPTNHWEAELFILRLRNKTQVFVHLYAIFD